jgi:hypothetical protein
MGSTTIPTQGKFMGDLKKLLEVEMNVHYKERKSPVGLSGKWSIPLWNYHIDCFVWVNKDGLLENVAHEDEDFIACYVHNPFRKHVGGLFGEIHIIEDEAKPGKIAHELEHALLDWIRAIPVNINTASERVCETMEGMTAAYWDEYFKVFLNNSPEMEIPAKVSDVKNQIAEPESPPTNPVDDRGNEAAS